MSLFESQGKEQKSSGRPSCACLRILVLHDEHLNAKETHLLLKHLDERLYQKHGIELVYINAPLVVVGEETGDDRRRVWWENGGEEHQYLGLDASLLHIQQIWKSTTFSGFLAFGQGASVAALLPMLLNQLEFGVLVNGKAIMEDEEQLMAQWPCLHVINESEVTDPGVQRLAGQLPGQIHVAPDSIRKAEMNAIGKFLVQQKKAMRTNGGEDELVLQNKLQAVEQEASRLIAKEIAEDPPKALMAVIQPQSVAGWHGRKRREFGAEGGGAPCPKDFLLKREKRTTNPNGPSRHHPNQQQKQQHTQAKGS